MRPSSRLLVPVLTILCWSLDSTYASFRPPGQGLSKRQFRTADYSTSTRPSHDPSNGAKSPETDTSSAPRSGTDIPSQTPAKTRRSPHYHTKSQLPRSAHPEEKQYSHSEDSTYIKACDGSPSSQHFHRRNTLPTSAGNNFQSMHVRDAFYKRTTSFPAQHKSGPNNDATSYSLNNQEKNKPDTVRRSAPIDLNTLHIARGLRKRQSLVQEIKRQPQVGVVKRQPPPAQAIRIDPASSPSNISKASGGPSA